MAAHPASPPRHSFEAARAACEVIEVLDVLWERGRDSASIPVSASQLRVLRSLDREKGISLRALGEMMGSAPSSVSRLCDRLESMGLVERSTSVARRRELELHLTSQGASCLRELRELQRQGLTAAVVTMSPAERQGLLEGLQGLTRAFHEPEADPKEGKAGPALRTT